MKKQLKNTTRRRRGLVHLRRRCGRCPCAQFHPDGQHPISYTDIIDYLTGFVKLVTGMAAAGGTRTHDLPVANGVLYPTELRRHETRSC